MLFRVMKHLKVNELLYRAEREQWVLVKSFSVDFIYFGEYIFIIASN